MPSGHPDLASQVVAAQSILETPAAGQAARLERALAACCTALASAMARLDPSSGAGVLDLPAGAAVFAGVGSPLTQVLALGIPGPVGPADLDRLEAFLAPGGSDPAQAELCPFAHPSAGALLAARGWRITEWQLVWTRPVPEEPAHPAPPGVEVRPARPDELDACLRAVMAGFLESEEVAEEAIALLRPTAHAHGHETWVALVDGEIAGGATLAWADGFAFVNGSGVRPRFRRRGAQGALIRARLRRARELGCAVAASSTLPGTPSGRNMERHGFRVSYPKVVMVRPAP